MELKAKTRTITGKKVKNLRKAGILPAVIFGKGKESLNIEVDYKKAYSTFLKAGETEIVDIVLDDNKYHTLIDSADFHPVKDTIEHINFRVVDLTQKVQVSVPLVVINEELNEKIKNGDALFLLQVNELEVEALPKNLPKQIEIDATKLTEIGDTLTLKEIRKTIDENNVEFTEEDNDLIIATLDYATQLEVEEETPASVEDVEIEEKGKKEESEEGTEKEPQQAKEEEKK